MIKAVIFDYDDTLVETRLIKYEHHKAVAKKFYNIDVTEETFLEHYGKAFNTLLKELYRGADTLENMKENYASVRDKYLKKVYPDSIEAINKILDDGFEIGILSATNKEFILNDLERYGFPVEKISFIQGAEETPVHKPDPRVFDPTLEQLTKEGIKSHEIVYIGDAMRDLIAAHGAGLHFIAVTTGVESKEDFEKAGAKYVISSLSELPDLIKKL